MTAEPVPLVDGRGPGGGPFVLDDVDAGESPRQRVWRRFRHNPAAMTGLVVLGLIVIGAVFAPWLAPHDPTATTFSDVRLTGPSGDHWLGVDRDGRDILSRLLYGGRASIEVCALVVVFALLVALPLGLVAGYVRGAVDAVIMRCMDALFAFPALTLALAVAALLGPSLLNASIAIAIVFVPGLVRVVRAQVLAVREETFIEASRSVGASSGRMMARHIFPNVATPLIVQIALSFGYALLAESGLSFLGFGVQPPDPSWGTMLQDAYTTITRDSWPLVPPGVAIAVTVLAFNLVGDGLRDALGREVHSAKDAA
ncbi:MAG TPA: ABC transporter permease [Acidimicrobiia bacterium]|nr:ABC transporter permease [Acidimicrobiia bacterium]